MLIFKFSEFRTDDKFLVIALFYATNDLSVYADADRVSAYAVESMQWAVGTGLIEGYTEGDVTILNSQGDALRCQVAALLMRLCENVLK